MVTHCRNDDSLCMFSQFLTDHSSEICIIALALLPDIMRSIIPSPYYEIQVVCL